MANIQIKRAGTTIETYEPEDSTTAYQKILVKRNPVKWYKGDTPTSKEVLGQIYRVGDIDKEKAQKLYSDFKTLQTDRTSQFYNPYARPTNQAVGILQSYGIDTSDPNFRQNYSWLEDYYIIGDTTNTPQKPGKNATDQQIAAYNYYQFLKSDSDTQEAKQQWAALQEEIAYWTNLTDRNYSDEEILGKINWKDYSTLTKMEAKLTSGDGIPLELNEAIDFSRDNLYGVIWAARNGIDLTAEDSPSLDYCVAGGQLGWGKTWQENEKLAERLDPTSRNFNPYAVGSTLEREGLYCGQSSWDQKWLDEHKDWLNSGDETKAKVWRTVNDAEKTTQAAENELALLDEKLNKKLENASSVAEAINIVKWLDRELNATGEGAKYTTLKRMNDGLEDAELVPTTRAVQFSRNDYVQKIYEAIANNALKADPIAAQSELAQTAGVVREEKPAPKINVDDEKNKLLIEAGKAAEERDKQRASGGEPNAVSGAAPTITSEETEAEEEEDTEPKPVSQDEWDELREAYDWKYGQGAWDAEMESLYEQTDEVKPADSGSMKFLGTMASTGYITEMTPEQKEIMKQMQEEVNSGTAIIDDIWTEAEQNVFTFAKSLATGNLIEAYNQVQQGALDLRDEFSKLAIKNSVSETSSSILEGTDLILAYEKNEDNLDQLRQRDQELNAALYGPSDLQYDLDVPGDPDSMKVTLPYNGENVEVELAYVPTGEVDENGNDVWQYQVQFIRHEDTSVAADLLDDEGFNAAVQDIMPKLDDIRDYVLTSRDGEGTEAHDALVEEYNTVHAAYEQAQQYHDGMVEDYNHAAAAQQAATENYNNTLSMLNLLGADTTELQKSGVVVDALLGFTEYEATQWEAYSAYDGYAQQYLSLLESGTPDAVKTVLSDAKEADDEVSLYLETARWLKDYAQRNGVNMPGKTGENLDRYISKLERLHQDYEYFALTARDDFAEEAEKGKEAARGWSMLNLEGKSLAGNLTAADLMTDYEQDTYYYLLATKGEKAAIDYYNYLTNDSYGILNKRTSDQVTAFGKEWAKSGFGGAVTANVSSVLLAPVAAVTNFYYAAKTGLQKLAGQDVELNPNSLARTTAIFRNATMEGTSEKILEELGTKNADGTYDSTLASDIAQMGLEIFRNRGDSIMNAVTFGWIFPGMNSIENEMLREFVGAMPMGLGAAVDAAAEVKERGGSDEQAYAIAGVTFLCETVTEAISVDNIKNAFASGQNITKDTIGEFFRNWLTRAGVSEAVGESLNDWLENKSDEVIMGYLSNHETNKRNYIEQLQKEHPDWDTKRLEDEAEALVKKDELSGILHTALVSYISPGADIFSYAAGKFNGARKITRFAQQRGNGVSIIDVMRMDKGEIENLFYQGKHEGGTKTSQTAVNPELNTNRQEDTGVSGPQEAPAGIEQGTAPASQTEAQTPDVNPELNTNREENTGMSGPQEAPEGTATATTATAQQEGQSTAAARMTEEQEAAEAMNTLDIAKGWRLLQNTAGKDTSTKTAAIAATLNTNNSENSNSIATAAAVAIGKVFGGIDNAVSSIRKMFTSAYAMGVNIETLKTALTTAALAPTTSVAGSIVQSDAFRNSIPIDQVKALVNSVQQDSQNKAAAKEMAASVHETRVAQKTQEQIANGGLADVKAAQEAADTAAQQTAQAEQDLKERQEAVNAASEAVTAASEELNEAISSGDEGRVADAMNASSEAINNKTKAVAVQEEYDQHLEKAKQNQQEKETAAKEAKDKTMKEIRTASEQAVAQEDQAAEEARQVAEAEAQAQAEAQAKAEAEAKAEQEEKDGTAKERENDAKIRAMLDSMNISEEEKQKVYERLKDRLDKQTLGKIDMSQSLSNVDGFLALSALSRKLGLPIQLSDGLGTARGKYSNGVIYLNKSMVQSGNMTVGQALVECALHEITHSLETTKNYGKYAKTVLDILYGGTGTAKYQAAIDQKIADYAKAGVTLTEADAEKELVADFARTHLNEKDTVSRFMDAGLGGKMRNILHNINQAIKNFTLRGEEKVTAENLRRAERLFQKGLEERAKTAVHPASEQFSIAQFAQATNLGMTYNEDTLQLFLPDGREVDGVNVKVTPEMMEDTPVGRLINMGLDEEQKAPAKKMFADLMNLCAKYRENNLVWEIAGSEFAETFSALKSNSDPQYKTTVDFGTICAKTQAIIDTLSGTMLKKIAEIKQWNEEHKGEGQERVFTGLTRADIMEVYNQTHQAKLSVPCPVCYVFSRWMGVPSLLGQMNKFQHKFVATEKDADGNVIYDENGDAKIDWEKTQKNVDTYLFGDGDEIGIIEKYGGKKGISDAKTSINNKIKTREESLPKLQQVVVDLSKEIALNDKEYETASSNIAKELEREDLTKAERRALLNQQKKLNKQKTKLETNLEKAKQNVQKNIDETDQLEKQRGEIECYNWVTQAVGLQHYDKNAKTYVNTIDGEGADQHLLLDRENFRLTPEEVLFDMNRTGEFAGYSKNWRYRTTRGAGMGKAIMPYSGASIGDIINGNSTRWSADTNPFLNKDNIADAQKALESAKKRVRQQNLVGGQRFQSTSDFRPEWGLDYVMSFLEMQALDSKVQMYTKVIEAVDFLGSIGADVNLSVMGQGDGYHEATEDEINQAKSDRKLRERMGVVDGKLCVLDFSDTTGISYNGGSDYEGAWEKTKKFNNVQMILVGMNDNHIKLAIGSDAIDFVIPWHSSGNSKDVLQSLVGAVGERLNESSDYTDYQTDKKKTRTVGEGKSAKEVDARSEDEIKLWNARVKLLCEGNAALTQEDREVLLSNPYTKRLYERFTVEGVDPDCYGVTLTQPQAEQVFPYEYWDKSTTRENADVNGKRFAEYCDALGLVPRFSQFKDEPGYWKLLIDRKMYDNNVLNEDGTVKEYGKYRDQKVVDVTKASIGQLPSSTTAKYGTNYSEQTSRAIENSTAAVPTRYDLQEAGQFSILGDITDADLDQMLQQAGVDYQDAMARGDMEAAQQDVDYTAEEKMPNSAIRDEDGNLLRVYHGTSESFNTFDMSKSRTNMDIQGAFFSPWELDAEGYGENVRAFYLNITNPATEQEGYAALRRYQGQNEAGRKARDYLISQGYDGVNNENQEYIAFYPEQIKSADTVTYDNQGNVIPLEQRFNDQESDIRYSIGGETTDADLDQMLTAAGVLEGTNPMATTATTDGEAQRAFGRGMLQDSDEIDRWAKAYVLNQNGYTPDTNAAQLDRAFEWIRNQRATPNSNGLYEALNKITSNTFDYRSADGQARMTALMGLAAATNDVMAQVTLADAFNRQGTDLGRALQARKIFRLMTPEGRIASLQKMADDVNNEFLKKGYKKDITFSDWILNAAAAAQTEEEFQRVQNAAAAELAEQMPPSWKERLQGWRMLSMLGNPRTHIRNVVGNAVFMPAVGLKNKVGALMEIATGQEERTKTLGFASPEARAFAKQDAQTMKDELTGEAKYKDGNLVQQNRRQFKSDFLQWLSDVNSKFLEGEDWIFLQRHYRNALAGYMTANGLTAESMRNHDTLDKARTYAINEAKKATYRDANKLASQLSKIGQEGGAAGFVVNAVLPFKKTPANILKRGVEYSPAGLLKSLTVDAYHLKQYNDAVNGKLESMPEKAISPTQWIDKFASGLTGSAIVALGAALAKLGIAKGGMDDDDDEFDKLEGQQEYSLNLFGQNVSFTVDWAAPVCMPFFVGVTLYEALAEEHGDENIDIGKMMDSIMGITEPVFNLSMLDGVNSLLETASYGEGNAITSIGEKVLANYATSYVPTALGQIARHVDSTRRKSYVESGASMSTFRYALEQVENKIPWLSKRNIPYRNVWGEADTSSYLWSAIENFFSPGYGNEIKEDAVTDELRRLYEQTGNAKMIPKTAGKTIGSGENKVVMNAEQYDTLVVERGQTAKNTLAALMETAEYQMADDATRADMVSDVWTYANQRANSTISENATKDKWVSNAEKTNDPVRVIIDRAVSRNQTEYINGHKTAMLEALEAGQMEDAETSIEALREMGKKDSSIKTYITNYFKPLWQDAMDNGREEEAWEIENILDSTEFSFDYGKWEVQEEEEDEEELTDYNRWMRKNQNNSSTGGVNIASGARMTGGGSQGNRLLRESMYRNTEGNLYGKGNIDLNHRQVVQNDDGTISTERSFSVNIDGKEVLLPTVINGRIVSEDEAIDHYYETGEYLGKFDTVAEADEYAEMLHNRQDWYYNR